MANNTGNLGGDLRGCLPSPKVIALTDKDGTRAPIDTLEEGKYLKVVGGKIMPGDGGGGGGVDDHLVLADTGDATPGTLEGKTVGTGGVSLSVVNDGGVKKLQIEGTPDDHEVKASADDTGHGPLSTKTKGVNGITLSTITEGGVKKLQIAGPTIPTGVTLSTEIPLPDGIGNAGNAGGGKATAERHVHPEKDLPGGDLFLVDAKDAVLITYYGTGTMMSYPSRVATTAPPGAFELSGQAMAGGNLGPY